MRVQNMLQIELQMKYRDFFGNIDWDMLHSQIAEFKQAKQDKRQVSDNSFDGLLSLLGAVQDFGPYGEDQT